MLGGGNQWRWEFPILQRDETRQDAGSYGLSSIIGLVLGYQNREKAGLPATREADNWLAAFLKRPVEEAQAEGIGLYECETGRLTAFVKNTTMVIVEDGAFLRSG